MPVLTIRNLTNSPFDLEGGHRLPAMGSVTAEFSDAYAAALRSSPGVTVEDGEPAKHRRAPASALDAMTDDELRTFIAARDGKPPHWNAGRKRLLDLAGA